MPSPPRRSFRVESPPPAKIVTLAVVGTMAVLCSTVSDGLIHDATLSSLMTFATMLTGAAAFLWPRSMTLGRDGVAVDGVMGAYRPWGDITSVRLESGYRGRVTIELDCRDASTWTIEPHFKVDASAIVAEMELRRRAFAEGTFDSLTSEGSRIPATDDYRVVAVEPHVRVLEDPRNSLDERVSAVRTIASVDRTQADRVVEEILEDTADPRARASLLRG